MNTLCIKNENRKKNKAGIKITETAREKSEGGGRKSEIRNRKYDMYNKVNQVREVILDKNILFQPKSSGFLHLPAKASDI
jgi:hypothetical protein